MRKVFESAIADIRGGLQHKDVWIALAKEGIDDQHRQTILGPIWLLINYLAYASIFIFVLHRSSEFNNYPAYVATGLLVWIYIMETLSSSVSLFVREESFIKGTTLPLSVYVLRVTMLSVLRTGYALIGCLGILLLSGVQPDLPWVWSGLAALIMILISPAVVTLFAFLGAYFRDSQFIVTNFMRIGMFLTPIFWVNDQASGIRHVLYWYNPFTYFLEIFRVPILGGDVPVRSFVLCVAIGLGLWGLSLYLLGRLRKQVVFVL